jgi:hypothetical protein
MDPELKANWIEALRSGEFKQAQGMLHDTKHDSFCCLGVLCKVAGAEWGECEKEVEGEDGYYIKTFSHVPIKDGQLLGNTDDEELEKWACDKFGIPDQTVLIGMNDGIGKEGQEHYQPPKTFSEIADYIEQNFATASHCSRVTDGVRQDG